MNEMDRLADLKGALYPTDGPSDELRARALAAVTGAGTAPRSTLLARRRWAAPALVAAGVAVVAAGAVLLGGTVGTPDAGDRGLAAREPAAVQPAAFTVHANADGSVTFTATDVLDTAAATQALNEAGIAGRVINDITAGCPTKSDDINPADLHPDNTISRGLGTSNTVTLHSSDDGMGLDAYHVALELDPVDPHTGQVGEQNLHEFHSGHKLRSKLSIIK